MTIQFERIVAVTCHANKASTTIMRKIGMRYENGVIHYGVDAVCYVVTRDEFEPDESSYVLSSE